MKRFLSSLLLSVFCLGAGSAMAADAFTTANVNLRNGPSTRYGVQATLPAGYPINVGQCQGSWCLINAGGYRGWISARYIAAGQTRPPVRPYVQGPTVVMPFIIGGYNNYDNRYRHHYRHRPPPPVYHRPPPGFHRPPPPPPGFHRPPMRPMPGMHNGMQRPPMGPYGRPPMGPHGGPPPMGPHGGPPPFR